MKLGKLSGRIGAAALGFAVFALPALCGLARADGQAQPAAQNNATAPAPPKHLEWLLQQVKLTSPLPVWADTPETSGDVKGRQLQKKGTLIIDYLPKDQSETDWKTSYTIMTCYTPGTTLEASEGMVRKTLAGKADVATEESAPDHRILRFSVGDAAGTEGVLYLGRYKDTIVTVREVWRNVGAATAAEYRARALAGMRQVVMEKGLNVLPLD